MISPLQIWQHSQPKRLWWILGGLSVLAHVGMLGLVLPYVLELVQSSNQPQSAVTTPIELIAVDSNEQATADSATLEESSEQSESTAANTATQSDDATVTAETAALTSASPGLNQPSSDNSDAGNSAENRSATSHSPSSSSSDSRSADSGSTDSEANDSGSADSRSADSGSAGDSSNDGSDRSDSPAPPSQNENLSGEEPTGPASGEPSTIEGGDPLPAPGELSGGEAEQVASLAIMGSSEVPESLQRDLANIPPRLISDQSAIAAIAWQPQSLGCGRVDFSQPTGTYKMAVNADGTLSQATLWTEGTRRPVSESEEAIACLLESADLRFEPAQLDGQPVFNDNLLLTVKVIELQAN